MTQINTICVSDQCACADVGSDECCCISYGSRCTECGCGTKDINFETGEDIQQ